MPIILCQNAGVPRGLRFLAVLVAGLATVTGIAWGIAHRTMDHWIERDLDLRARLAVRGARRQLLAHWSVDERPILEDTLGDITRDERILGAAACAADGATLGSTPDFPGAFSCGRIAHRVRATAAAPSDHWHSWKANRTLPGGPVHVSAITVRRAGVPIGFVVLLHDLAFAARRESQTQVFLLGAFGILALAAAVITILAARWSWRDWGDQLRRSLHGGGDRPEFRPIVRDLRDLVERLMAERETDREGGAWTAERLKQTLNRYLQGERVVILANREPYIHERDADGTIRVVHPASGLVTALEPVMRACSGVWVAHGSGSADRDVVDAQGRVAVPPGEGTYSLRRVWLSSEEEKGYYYGLSNEGLWPLCHLAHTRPVFREEDFRQYRRVNERFAEAVCQEVDSDDPILLVQDYHFALAPKMIRQHLPRATILMFWHIPWPNSERFAICPWSEEILDGMLGASILGFHTRAHCNNFVDAVDRILEARLDREQNAVVQRGRSTLVRPYPIATEWPVRWTLDAPSAAECRAEVFAELGLADDALLGVGVDRLDYTKGVEERLAAVDRALERFEDLRGRFSFVQLAAPSRTEIDRYRELNERVEAVASRINDRWATGAWRPIHLLHRHHEPPVVFRFYRAADLCYVSSLHDGMNLVAKEFVAARDDERGALVLSQFTGAARELTEALIVNPYDLEESSAALAAALRMPRAQQAERMRAMRAYLAEFNVYRWAGRMLVDAARLRRKERLVDRLDDPRSLSTTTR